MTTLQLHTQQTVAPSELPGAAEAARRIARRHHEPEWMLERRIRALDAYAAADLPDRVAHLWLYSDPKQFAWTPDAVSFPADPTDDKEAAPALEPMESAAATAVARLGASARVFLPAELRARGVILADLHTAAVEHEALVRQHLATAVPETHGKFEALNLALWQDGLFVYLPRNTRIEKPLHLLVEGDARRPFQAARVLVVAESGAQLTLVLEFAQSDDASFASNVVVELIGGDHAQLRYVNLQRWGDQATSFLTQRARLGRDASLLAVYAGLGGRITKADLGTRLEGPGAETKFLGLAFAEHKQHFDHHTEHRHAAGRTRSDLDFKAVLKDRARSAYTGLIRIEERATGCEAYQENRNLLLTKGPRVDTIPELEILNDDVQCTHGATVGPIDPEQLFYLQARGIDRVEAARLIAAGFVESTLTEVPEDLRERLRAYVAERLEEL